MIVKRILQKIVHPIFKLLTISKLKYIVSILYSFYSNFVNDAAYHCYYWFDCSLRMYRHFYFIISALLKPGYWIGKYNHFFQYQHAEFSTDWQFRVII